MTEMGDFPSSSKHEAKKIQEIHSPLVTDSHPIEDTKTEKSSHMPPISPRKPMITANSDTFRIDHSMMSGLTAAQIAEKLESQRLSELKLAAFGMKGSLVSNGRCPKCTLKPPCKHYQSSEELP